MGETWGFSQLWDKTWENPNLIKIPETPYKIRFYRQYNFIVFRFSQVSTFFYYVHAKQVFAGGRLYFFLASPPHKQKNTEIYPLHSYIFLSENQQFPLLKNPASLNPPLPFPHISNIFYSSKHQKLPIYKP